MAPKRKLPGEQKARANERRKQRMIEMTPEEREEQKPGIQERNAAYRKRKKENRTA